MAQGQFWPRSDMAALGQSEKIILEKVENTWKVEWSTKIVWYQSHRILLTLRIFHAWWHRTLRWKAASCWVEYNAWTRRQLRAPSTPKHHSLLVSRFFLWMFMVIQWFLHCQQYVIRQVGCELDFLGDNLKEDKSLSDEVKDTSSENGVQEEKNAACFTNNRLNALYSIFIWWVKLYIWHLTNISNSWIRI